MPVLLYDVSLRGVSLSSLADEIIVRDIVEMPPTEDRQTSKRAMHAGTRVNSVIRRTLPIKIVYNVRAYNGTRRAEIMDKISEWVGIGGKLTITTRPGKRLFVKPEGIPRLDSTLKWTEDLTMTLTAYEQPYWEDEAAVVAQCEAKWSEAHSAYYDAKTISVPGNLPKVPMTMSLWNTSDDILLTSLKIVADETFFEFKDIAIEPGGIFAGFVEIKYDENDILSIVDVMTEVSLMKNRTAESSDDLLVRCGKTNQIHIYADAPCRAQFEARGRWL